MHSPCPNWPRRNSGIPGVCPLAERNVIADLRRRRGRAHQIARLIGRSPSTISREPPRDTGPSGRYRPNTADQLGHRASATLGR
ncbi:helix-turn-helix domain-containing protein [Segniliparus rugosus]|uniref:helix-turn-helix domain-containing protein n=1 Tax=Segniliparus rugosus TaxID=286804 RepID=UPI003CC74201